MQRPITVGIDGSLESLAAANWAAREARSRGLPLRLVHAWHWQVPHAPVAQDRKVQEHWVRRVVRDAHQDLADRFPDVRLTSDVLREATVPALLSACADAEMLVLGSRGHGAVAGFLLGSYGRQVVAAAERPVVCVRGDSRGGDSPSERGAVVVGQHGTGEDSEEVLAFAFGAAAARGVAVRAVRAWNLPPSLAYSPVAVQFVDGAEGLQPWEEKELAEALVPWRERYPGVPVVEHVELGSAGRALLTAAATADLVVVGRRTRRSPVGTRIGSVAHAVLHHAPCPVAVVPHG
ncbi:universal stress protein [Streptomyces buecherae]|uniref:Universal stress protein n=1 Tax=Streptomyces buecherae TaxID=2763006 RepID=A0A7H8N2I6_9ACTN|nr:universal stress protein [Streptomyces buecherae]QKW48642.1 universal stress protein [Streptomyces buecherae]